MGNMKVCLVTTSFPRRSRDSSQNLVLETARALRDQGAQVRVIAIHAPGAPVRETFEGIEVIRPRYMWPDKLELLQTEGGGLPVVWRKRKLARPQFALALLAQGLAVARYARECDVIHAHWTLSAFAVWITRLYHCRPYVVTVHGSDIFQAAQIPLFRALTRLALSRADRVVAISQSLADATKTLGIPTQKIDVIPEGIDIELFQPGPTEREPLLLFVGSLIERKGIKHLIRAMPKVRERLPGYRLAIVGEGPQREELTSLIDELDLEESVTLVGAQPQDQVVQWMQRARLFVLPSLEEGLGIVILEALASGTPCIGTRVGGIPELISPDVGRLVPPADSKALANAALAILQDAETWQTLSCNARQRAEQHCYTWNKVAVRLTEIYEFVRSDSRL
jgi:glycosyltransferase involved in cell wall biosynthesis